MFTDVSMSIIFCVLGSVSVVFLHYDNIGPLMKPDSDPGVNDYSRYAEAGEITVNSPVIAAAISPPNVIPLDHVTFTLKHHEVPVYILQQTNKQYTFYIR